MSVTNSDIVVSFDAAKRQLGALSASGVVPPMETSSALGASEDHFDQFRKCINWLRLAFDEKSGRKLTKVGSYFLKHVVERWDDGSKCSYVSNGVLIAAAVHFGAEVEASAGSINALVRIPLKLDRALGADSHSQSLFSFARFHDPTGFEAALANDHGRPASVFLERSEESSPTDPWKDVLHARIVRLHKRRGDAEEPYSFPEEHIERVVKSACFISAGMLLHFAQDAVGWALHEEGVGGTLGSVKVAGGRGPSDSGPFEPSTRQRLGMVLATKWLHMVGADLHSGKIFSDIDFAVYSVADVAAAVAKHFEDPVSRTECGALTDMLVKFGVGTSVLSVGVVTAAMINYGAQLLISFDTCTVDSVCRNNGSLRVRRSERSNDAGTMLVPAVSVRTTVPLRRYGVKKS